MLSFKTFSIVSAIANSSTTTGNNGKGPAMCACINISLFVLHIRILGGTEAMTQCEVLTRWKVEGYHLSGSVSK